MKKINRLISVLVTFAVLIVALQSNPAFGQDTGQTATPNTEIAFDDVSTNTQIQFGLIDENHGWVAIDDALYISDNQGETWADITPKQELGVYQKIAIQADGQGSIISVNLHDESIQATVLKTRNFGEDWQIIDSNLQFVLLNNHAGPIEELFVQWHNADVGWLMAKQVSGINFSHGVLLRTIDGGKYWSALPCPAGERFVFIDTQIGFMHSPAKPEIFYYTSDGGQNWEDFALPTEPLENTLFTVKLPVMLADGGLIVPLELEFEDGSRQVGFFHTENLLPNFKLEESFELIKSKVSESSNHIHDEELVQALMLNTDTLSFLNKNQGWGLFEGGECQEQAGKIICRYVRELRSTTNGGESWQLLRLPKQVAGDVRTFSFPTSLDNTVDNQVSTGQVGIYKGQAFDACEIPSLAQLNNWFQHSPYRGVNLYIGGISRLCANSNLNEAYITEIARQGWRLIPTWVGHQPPCTSFKYPFPYDVDEAFEYGVNNANQAKDRMETFGLLNSDGRGGVVYLDVESFNTSNEACVAATRAYIRGWTTRMNELGIMGAMYASSINLNKAKIYNLSPAVPAVWIAEWNIARGFNPDASVYDLRHLPNDYWYSEQRLRQYSGEKYETWGGVTIEIDPNVADGPVMALTNLPPSRPVVSITLNGQKGLDDWYKSQVNVFIHAYDYGVGIDKVYRRIDEGPWKEYQPFGVNGSGKKTISYYAVNNAGLQSDIKSISFYVDNQPPINPSITKIGCDAISGIPQARCNDASFEWSGAYDAGVGLDLENTYQVYWGTDPYGTSTDIQNTTYFDPPAIPANTAYFLRIRTQDRHEIWSEWQTLFALIYGPDYQYFNWYAPIRK